ncbi:hypothetical protein [Arthrobacter sp. MMS18-M83]|uniref:hypothetical protein n=1 Tax=Arthrobacter sp. MMS18-M83 TaxID=2996261 RepID=UPI00227C786E|nr:hypothetical protein [Arthrobacter sp. MMS18-M83]WAH97276.1 hypothetical protein OW521_23545 [Arthrobacter sp. MMS18-M83]
MAISKYSMTMYRNFNARAERLPANHCATVLAHAEAVHDAGTISGDVVLTGPRVIDGPDRPIVDANKSWLIRFDKEQSEPAGVGD